MSNLVTAQLLFLESEHPEKPVSCCSSALLFLSVQTCLNSLMLCCRSACTSTQAAVLSQRAWPSMTPCRQAACTTLAHATSLGWAQMSAKLLSNIHHCLSAVCEQPHHNPVHGPGSVHGQPATVRRGDWAAHVTAQQPHHAAPALWGCTGGMYGGHLPWSAGFLQASRLAQGPKQSCSEASLLFSCLCSRSCTSLQGQASDIRIHTTEILRLRDRLNELYMKHTGQDRSTIGE